MFEGLFQPMHLIIILVVVLIIFGPGKLPKLGSALGQGIREFKTGIQEAKGPIDDAAKAVTEPVTPVCPKCGATISDGQRFCAECATPLSASSNATSRQA